MASIKLTVGHGTVYRFESAAYLGTVITNVGRSIYTASHRGAALRPTPMVFLSAALSWCKCQVIPQSEQQSTQHRQTLNTLPTELQERIVIAVWLLFHPSSLPLNICFN